VVTPSLTQFQVQPGVIDLSWGMPDPTLLPVEQLRAAADRALHTHGPSALAYGNPAGPPPLIEFITQRLAQTDARAPTPAEVLVTSGASQGLDLAIDLALEPGDTALVDVPTYHLALHILRDHPIHLAAIKSDTDGIDLDDLARVVATLRTNGERPRLLYTIPTFRNPTGSSLPADRRTALIDFATANDLVIVEDDTYRELSYDGPSPPSLWAQDTNGTVIRLGSFAKSVAPGLRVGYVTATPDRIDRLATRGVLDSGGGTTHFSALVLAEYAASGDYAAQVERLKDAYRSRRDALLAGLDAHMPKNTTWTRPSGGYFVWVDLPPGTNVLELTDAARANGVGFVPAGAFFLDPDTAPPSLRLSFAMYAPADLTEAATRLAGTTHETIGSF
jgi:DNA-binding transcriptional MocR family regulator